MKIEIFLTIKKLTKGTVVYQQSDDDVESNPVIPTVYIRKSALPSTPPQNIMITIEENK